VFLIASLLVIQPSQGFHWKTMETLASVTYIRCEIGEHILSEGWNNWRDPLMKKTARYAEYKSIGTGANIESRVKWAKQLSDEEVKVYTLKIFLEIGIREKMKQIFFLTIGCCSVINLFLS